MASWKKRKKPSLITTVVAVDRIDQMVKLTIENVKMAIQLAAMLETGNEVIHEIRGDAERGPNWYWAHCYNAVITSMTLNLAMSLARLFDPGTKRFHPNKRDVASIPLLLRLVKQKRCRSALCERARDWPLGDETTVLREIDAAAAVYKGLTSKYRERSAVTTLKTFRDKKLAHSLINTDLKSRPRFEQLYLLLDTAMKIASHLRLAINGENWNPEEFRTEGRRQGKAFWGPAIKAVIETERTPA